MNYIYAKIAKWRSNNQTIVGKLYNTITVYAQKNDKEMYYKAPIKSEKFEETPVLYSIEGQSSSSFIINTPTRAFTCVLDNDVNVQNNHCIIRRSEVFVGNCFKGTLNHPVEIVLELKGQVTINGYFDANDTFHIKTISNYDITL